MAFDLMLMAMAKKKPPTFRPTEGSEALDRALDLEKERGEGSNKIAREIGISIGLLSHYRTGDRMPGLLNATRIRDRFGIPVDDWSKPAKRKSKKAA